MRTFKISRGTLPGAQGDKWWPSSWSPLLRAFQEIPAPQTATKMHSFLGPASYYWRYVKGFATIAGPLHAFTCKDALLHWTPECQNIFDRLKLLLMMSPVTAFPDFSLPFCINTDASTMGLGAIVAQSQDGKECIICCALRLLNQAEKAYPTTKLKCLAIVWVVEKFHPYLMALKFNIYTDHYTLQSLKMMHTGFSLLHHWSTTLEDYDFAVKYHPGKIQAQVDRLSRLPVDPPPDNSLFQLQALDEEDEAHLFTQEIHTATQLGGEAL